MNKQEVVDSAMDKLFSNLGLAITIYLQEKMLITVNGEKERMTATNPLTSIVASAVLSFILGVFINTYSVNTLFELFNSAHGINWFLGGVLAIIPKLGRFTILVFVPVFLIKNCLY